MSRNSAGTDSLRCRLLPALAAAAASLLWSCLATADSTPAPDQSWTAAATRPPEYTGMERRSFYVSMRDGVKLAIDVWLPVGLAGDRKLPAILEQTRYYRSALVKSDPHGSCRPPGRPTIELFVTRGYAYVIVDVRGTGASFGTRTTEYSGEEVKDGAQIVDWIVHQGWSDGTVGSQGQSYVGTTAELLLSNRHPAVKAVAPSFSGYDFYSEILSPGGIRNSAFGKVWSEMVEGLDRSAPAEASPILGPCPVDEDKDQSALRRALAQHAGNRNVWQFLQQVEFRDDRAEGIAADAAGPYHQQAAIDASNAPLYAIVGWYDSGYALGAIRRYLSSSSPSRRVLIGPWNHGARYFYAPGIRVPTPSSFDLAAEKLRYFDSMLKGIDAGFSSSPPIRYFTTGSNRWQGTTQWPPPDARPMTLYLGAHGSLVQEAPHAAGVDDYVTVGSTSSGDNNRWHTTMGPFPVAYADRAAEDRQLLTYTSSPLPSDMEITGNPLAKLFLATDRTDADVFVYLEEVTVDGQVNYVTEGELKASRAREGSLPFRTPGPVHSDRRADRSSVGPGRPLELEIGLLPLSHVFRAGNRIRVAIAAADRGQFDVSAADGAKWQLFRSAAHASQITIPVIVKQSRHEQP
jgi:uncharacterized protein